MNLKNEKFADIFASPKVISFRSRKNLPSYMDFLFGAYDFTEKAVLDVGGGSGFASYWAKLQGAAKVICLEPMADGSNDRMLDSIARASTMFPEAPISYVHDPLENYGASQGAFDIVCCVNAINHFDESSCAQLHASAEAQARYVNFFTRFAYFVKPGGACCYSRSGSSEFVVRRGHKVALHTDCRSKHPSGSGSMGADRRASGSAGSGNKVA